LAHARRCRSDRRDEPSFARLIWVEPVDVLSRLIDDRRIAFVEAEGREAR